MVDLLKVVLVFLLGAIYLPLLLVWSLFALLEHVASTALELVRGLAEAVASSREIRKEVGDG